MSVKSQFFKLNKEDFDSYLQDLKESSNSIHLLDGKFFFNQSLDVTNQVIELNTKIVRLDCLIDSFSNFSKKQIIQSFLIDEIQSTNKIENVFSTKHDVLKAINGLTTSKNAKIISIANAYKLLLEHGGSKINSCLDIRSLYEIVLKDAIEKEDFPDGMYFRKGPVYITNGIKPIHTGVYGEKNINKGMEEFIHCYNSKNELYVRMILCHFMFEYIHPYYDGNGRLGRFLFSNGVYSEARSYFSFAIAIAFLHEKSKYYKAFEKATDKYEFGCLNAYVETILKILLDEVELLIKQFSTTKEKLNNIKHDLSLTPSEEKIFKFISEASLFSYFGVTNEEIMKETHISKRTLMSSLAKFKGNDILIDTRIGKYAYHKFK